MATQAPPKRKWGAIATVTLIVGESKTPFHLHEEVLFQVSSVFKTEFNSKLREKEDRTMNLPEDDVGAFEDFAEWLYTRGLGISAHPPDTRFLPLFKLLVLADKYHIIELKNLITTEKIFTTERILRTAPSLDVIGCLYAHSGRSSRLRKLFADCCTWNLDLAWFKRPDVQTFLRLHPDCATDFTVSLANRLMHPRDPFTADMPEEYTDKESRQES